MTLSDCPLPGHTQQWSRSKLGPFKGWDHTLKSHVTTISSLTYPSAIFVGAELILLHNKAWLDAGGIDQQGCPQRGSLSPDTWSALQKISHDGQPKQIAANDLLRVENDDSSPDYLVLLSPLFDCDSKPTSVMAQMIPSPNNPSNKNHTVCGPPAKKRHRSIDGRLIDDEHDALDDIVNDNIPMDEHPFFHRFAEMLPSGLAILDHQAKAVFVNQHFYDLTTHKGAEQSYTGWPESIHPDDKQRVLDAYQTAFRSQKQLRTEFRALITDDSHPWRLLLLTPLGDENLRHVSLREYGGFICSIVDISSEKSAELAERKAAKEAEERKVVLTSFIDMVSHEIRNPLSAVLHCSEDISEAVSSETPDIEVIREAVNTINICIMHQKNIVDDVLSFSKLDASMLALVPNKCQPCRYLADSLKMFRPEFRKQGIDFAYTIEKSYTSIDVEWVMADMARISQVLINLVTNAIKFTTKTEGKQKLRITVGASKDRPSSFPDRIVKFVDEDVSYRMDATNLKDWGRGEALYIMVAVRDTGIGISALNQQQLFGRFKQATPKTAEKYGGSGLGLNIAKKLCQLHGGEIAVNSKEGVGSTFAFFFRVTRTDPPEDRSTNDGYTAIDTQKIEEQMRELGDASAENLDHESLPSTPNYDSDEAEAEDENDVKRVQTSNQGNGSNVDSYSNAERPDISKIHRGKESKQSINVQTPDVSEKSEGETFTQSPNETGPRPHVLLVEDNMINQRLVFRKLEQRGFNVTTANNGREAVEAVHKAPKPSSGSKEAYDIILMDNEMPILDGNSATREIRELEEKGEVEHIPILGVTANARGAQQEEMILSGMDDVISKPYSIGDMVEKIRKITMSKDGAAEETR